MPYQKSVEEYRRDIFALKSKLKEENEYLEELKQKYSDLDVFDDKSYSFSMKLKIHEYNLNGIKQQMEKYHQDEAWQFYSLNYGTLAFVKACEIFSMTREMVFRAIDANVTHEVNWFEFCNFLKETLKINSEFVEPIMKVLDRQNAGKIKQSRFLFYLECFMINSERENKPTNTLDECCENIVREMIVSKVDPSKIWRVKELNVAILGYGICRKIKNLDILETVALYCKLDPLKKGFLPTQSVVDFLELKMTEMKNYEKQGMRLKK